MCCTGHDQTLADNGVQRQDAKGCNFKLGVSDFVHNSIDPLPHDVAWFITMSPKHPLEIRLSSTLKLSVFS